MRLIDRDALIAEYDRLHIGKPGQARQLMVKAPAVDAIPVQYILTTIREWNRDGYAESAEALEILVMNWDKENTEWAERRTDE